MFGSIRWKLSVTYLIVVSSALVFVGVHLAREFEAVYTRRTTVDLLNFARVVALHAYEGLSTKDPAEVRLHLRGAGHESSDPRFVITDASGTIVGVVGEPESAVGTRDTAAAVGSALAGAEVAGVDRTHGSDAAVYAAVPVRSGSGGRVVGVVYAWLPLGFLGPELQHNRWVIGGSVSAAFLVAAILGAVLARGIAGPIQEMQRVANRLAAGRLGERVPVRSRDELGELARSLNYMAGELERVDATRRAFIADASHELRTPVANLAVAVEALQAVIGTDPDQARAASADLEREVKRLTELIENLLDLSLAESGQVRLNLAALSPGELALRAVHPFQGRAAQAGVTLSTEIPQRLSRVTADADRTVQVLTSLLDNALKVTPREDASRWERRNNARMYSSAWPTPGRGSRRRSSLMSSTGFIGSIRQEREGGEARASASRSPNGSSKPRAASSWSRASPGRAPGSSWFCRRRKREFSRLIQLCGYTRLIRPDIRSRSDWPRPCLPLACRLVERRRWGHVMESRGNAVVWAGTVLNALLLWGAATAFVVWLATVVP